MVKSLVLLSGGLDSVVSLGLKKQEFNTDLALTFDYGQKSAQDEISACAKICDFYKINHKVIKLGFLREITNSSLVSDVELPKGLQNNSDSVWVPNRNGLFLNIAGAYADSYNYDYIIFGANKEEGETFPDNTPEFIERINSEFEYSTKVHPKVIAPLINYCKNDIVRLALENNIPLELVMSCYKGGGKHCGECESCTRLKNALRSNNAHDYIKTIFG